MANSFTNAIRWMKITKTSYECIGDLVTNVCKALGNVDIQDINSTLTRIARKQDVADRDVQIAKLIQKKGELETRLAEKEVDLKREEAKNKRTQRLFGLLEDHVRNMGDVVTKARLYNEVMAKTGTITSFKLIHICVDYSAKMETILAEMWSLFSARNRFVCSTPIPLDKVLDLAEFPELPLADVLQGLHTSTTLRTNPDSSRSKIRRLIQRRHKDPKVQRTVQHQLRIRLLPFRQSQPQPFHPLQLPLPII